MSDHPSCHFKWSTRVKTPVGQDRDIVFYNTRSSNNLVSGQYLQPPGMYNEPSAIPQELKSELYDTPRSNPHQKSGKVWDFSRWIPNDFQPPWDISTIGPPHYEYRMLSLIKEKDIAHEIRRFLKCLEYWDEFCQTKKVTATWVWNFVWTYRHEAADLLDDMFAYSLRETFGIKYSVPELDERIYTVKLDSYDDLFPARFSLKWEEPDPEDYKYSLVDSPNPGEGILESYEYHLEQILEGVPDDIPLIEDEEILSETGTTTSWVKELGLKGKMPHWQTTFKSPRASQFAEKSLDAIRCVVPVYPGGVRDTAIVDRPCNNSIRWIERQLNHVLEYVPESVFSLHPTTFETRKQEVVNSDLGFYVLRDMKKCGLTHNSKHLFPILERGLKKKFPHMPWERLGIFKHLSLMMEDGELVYPKRGYFLGMANSLVTLSLCVIYRMAVEIALDNVPVYKKSLKFKAIIGNDDSCVSTNDLHFAEQLMAAEKFLSDALDNYFNVKKSFISSVSLFYEEYGHPNFKEKFSLVANTLAVAEISRNIRSAKLFVQSQSYRFRFPRCQEALSKVVASYPYEFYPQEAMYNYELGGWLDTRHMGLKTTLIDYEECLKLGVDRDCLEKAIVISTMSITPPSEKLDTDYGYVGSTFISDISENSPYVRSIAWNYRTFQERYKKLTVWTRNLTKRFKRLHWASLKWKPKWENDEDILKVINPKDFYCIPEFAVKRRQDWGHYIDAAWDNRPDKPIDNRTLRQMKASDPNVQIKTKYILRLTLADFEIDVKGLRVGGEGVLADLSGNAGFFGGVGITASREYYHRKKMYPIINEYVLPPFKLPSVALRLVIGKTIEELDLPFQKSYFSSISCSSTSINMKSLREIQKENQEDAELAFADFDIGSSDDPPSEEEDEQAEMDILFERYGIRKPKTQEEIDREAELEEIQRANTERDNAFLLSQLRGGTILGFEEDRMRDPAYLQSALQFAAAEDSGCEAEDFGGIDFGDDADY